MNKKMSIFISIFIMFFLMMLGCSKITNTTGPSNVPAVLPELIPISQNATYDKVLSSGTNETWFIFSAKANQSYTIELFPVNDWRTNSSGSPISDIGNSIDTYLFIFKAMPGRHLAAGGASMTAYQSEASYLGSNDDKAISSYTGNADDSLFSRKTFVSPIDGNIFVMVTPYNKGSYFGEYRIAVTSP